MKAVSFYYVFLEINLPFLCSGNIIFYFQPLFKLRLVEILSSSVLPMRSVPLRKKSALLCGKAKLWPVGNTYVLDAALPGNFWFLPA